MLSSLPPSLRRHADLLLDQSLDLPPDERQAELVRTCNDQILLDTVSRLLQAAEIPSSPIDPDSPASQRLLTSFAAMAHERETPLGAGALVGPYRILEEIGRGGMAVIFRAERIDGQFKREVAVKVLKLGIDTEEVIRRFEQERQILADLNHPNIAGLLDAGHTEDGRPFFVMELVAGQSIDRYCTEHGLSLEAKLKLFLLVCEAVECAHQNLIVHRDLKPRNVLVTSPSPAGSTNPGGGTQADGECRVKLRDFGIARLLEPNVDDAAPATVATMRLMTPEYASPEQVRGERVTTASDVYQLGLILYELLTGQRPYSLQGRSASEIEQVICELEPARLSALAGKASRALRGDLENIVSKALSKDPVRRYSSADRLAEDIRRYLSGRPVTARPDTWLYRSGKFVRRHTLAATTLTLMAVITTGITSFYLIHLQGAYQQAETQRVQAQLERDRAENERLQAQVERDRAQAVTSFMNDLFGNADSVASRGNEVTVREVLDQGAQVLSTREDLSPTHKGSMLLAMGRAYNSLGLSRDALPLLISAQSLLADSVGTEEKADILGSLAYSYSNHGDFRAMEAVIDEAIALLQTLNSQPTEKLIGLQIRKLDSQLALMNAPLTETTAQLREIVTQLEDRAGATSDALLLQGYMPLSYAYSLQEADAQAVEIARRAVEVAARIYGSDDLRLLSYNFYYGSSLRRTDPELAVSILQPLSDDFMRLMGPNLSVASTLNSLGVALGHLGRTEDAIEALEQSIDIALANSGETDRGFLVATMHLARFHLKLGQAARAQELMHTVLPVLSNQASSGVGIDTILYANGLSIQASILANEGRPDAAERIYVKADQMLESVDPNIWPQVRTTILEGMAETRLEQGHQELARDALDRLDALLQRHQLELDDERIPRMAALRLKLDHSP